MEDRMLRNGAVGARWAVGLAAAQGTAHHRGRGWRRLVVTAVVVGSVLWGTAAVQAARRVALVIGNGAYSVANGRLTTPVRDAAALRDALQALGYDVQYEPDLPSKEAMERAVEVFGQRLAGAQVGLFYYSGHGVQLGGTNYLIPTHASITKAHQVKFEDLFAIFGDILRTD